MHAPMWHLSPSRALSRPPAISSSSSSSRRPVGPPAQHRPHHARHALHSPSATTAESASTTGSSIQLRRLQLPGDDMQWGSSSSSSPAPQQQPEPSPSTPGSKRKQRGMGFGGRPNSSSSNGSAARQQQQQQQQQRVVVQPGDRCPCRSGLPYEACCQPFLSGHSQARSAPELARARITAALTGEVPFLVASTHPDSSLALGGSRDLTRRSSGQAAAFRETKPVVVGMAHCCGETDDTWCVLAIFQDAAGPSKGSKWPLMYLMAKRGSSSSSSSSSDNSSSSSSSSSGAAAGDWLYMGTTNSIPQHQDAEAILQLLQLHVPELLRDVDGSSSNDAAGAGAGAGGMTSAEVCFVWGTPALGLPTAPKAAARAAAAVAGTAGSSSSPGSWYLDLMQPAVEPLLGAGKGGGSSGSARRGLISMDAVIEARRQAAPPAQQGHKH